MATSSKSLTKRLKITKNGKVVRRRMGVSHFRTRKSSKTNREGRTMRGLNISLKTLKAY